jgi:hypothetical protein
LKSKKTALLISAAENVVSDPQAGFAAQLNTFDDGFKHVSRAG